MGGLGSGEGKGVLSWALRTSPCPSSARGPGPCHLLAVVWAGGGPERTGSVSLCTQGLPCRATPA